MTSGGSYQPLPGDDRCVQCAFPPAACLCAEIPRVSTRLRLLVLRHAAERNKTTSSVRWAALALGCPVIDYAATPAPFDPGQLDLGGAWLLFPGADPTPPPAIPPRTLLVPDGTWQQARKMVLRQPALRALPRLTLGPGPPRPRLRRPHQPEGMSTLEAMAAALELCGEPQPAAQLRAVYDAAVRRTELLRGPLPW
jgi:DTW domain-containing protein YfiP